MSTKKKKKRQKINRLKPKSLIYADSNMSQEYAFIKKPNGDKRFTAKLINSQEKLCRLSTGVARKSGYLKKNSLVLIEPTSTTETTVWRIVTVYNDKEKNILEKKGLLNIVDETVNDDLGFTFETEEKIKNKITVDDIDQLIDIDDL